MKLEVIIHHPSGKNTRHLVHKLVRHEDVYTAYYHTVKSGFRVGKKANIDNTTATLVILNPDSTDQLATPDTSEGVSVQSIQSDNSAFSPGPWKRGLDRRKKGNGIRGISNSRVVDVNGNPVAYAYRQKSADGQTANADLITAAPDMYSALKMVCEDCEKLSDWEDMFNIGRPEGSIMPKCPCDGCYVKEALMKANGEAFQEIKNRRRIADIAFEMYDLLDHIEDVLDDSSGCGEISVEEIRKVLKKARGEER